MLIFFKNHASPTRRTLLTLQYTTVPRNKVFSLQGGRLPCQLALQLRGGDSDWLSASKTGHFYLLGFVDKFVFPRGVDGIHALGGVCVVYLAVVHGGICYI
jgi:hypothetical protein